MRKNIGGEMVAGGKKYDLGRIENPFNKFEREFYFAAVDAANCMHGESRKNIEGLPIPLSEMSEHCLSMMKAGLLDFSRLDEKRYRWAMMSCLMSRLVTFRDANKNNDERGTIWPLCLYELD